MVESNFDTLTREEKYELVSAIQDKKNGVSDYDWSELVDKFGLQIRPDTLRKAGVGIALADEAGLLNLGSTLSSEEVVKPKDEKAAANVPESDTQGYIERQMVRDLRTEIRSDLRAESRSQALREVIAESISKLEPIKIAEKMPLHHYDPGKDNRSLVVALGDFHYGAESEIRGIEGEIIHIYSPEIFEGYMAKLLMQLALIIEKENIDRVDVMLVGD